MSPKSCDSDLRGEESSQCLPRTYSRRPLVGRGGGDKGRSSGGPVGRRAPYSPSLLRPRPQRLVFVLTCRDTGGRGRGGGAIPPRHVRLAAVSIINWFSTPLTSPPSLPPLISEDRQASVHHSWRVTERLLWAGPPGITPVTSDATATGLLYGVIAARRGAGRDEGDTMQIAMLDQA